MKAIYLLICMFAVTVIGTPAKRDCPQQQCVNITDSCGEPVRECWDDCALGLSERPTFVVPSCSVSTPILLATALGTAPARAAFIPPDMTSAPYPIATSPTEGCKSEKTICIDYLKECANGTYSIPYGGCHDACSIHKVYLAPSCSKTWIAGPTTTKTKTKKPSVTRPACKNAKSFMCAPLNWLL
ncbi:hypothetical protein DPSP01_002260 [Paraphaeosphaeria sporulosa]|uniref:Kazal-like domain-containing protein n=1 Tax=Paraphaeosphaeria sporulosa TaxID=1460663 RepID=A0A177C1V2_9PLEO|nr:uncharacterized protein CC84DRAFT_1180603 [Paraphaeosphaeria sporulosa]OAG00610.1 hypothetical protein CC84DRAFT_1180603 [Paraphaeosphaeria sporulosa]